MKCIQRQTELSASQELIRKARSQKMIQTNEKILGRLHCRYFNDICHGRSTEGLSRVRRDTMLQCTPQLDCNFKAVKRRGNG